MKIEILEEDFTDCYILKIKHIRVTKRDEYGKDHCEIFIDSNFVGGCDHRLHWIPKDMINKAIEVGVFAISVVQLNEDEYFDLEGFGCLCLCGFFEFFDPKLHKIAIEAMHHVSNKFMMTSAEKEPK